MPNPFAPFSSSNMNISPLRPPQTNTIQAPKPSNPFPANTNPFPAGASQFNNKSTLNPTNQTLGSTYGNVMNSIAGAVLPGYNQIKSLFTGQPSSQDSPARPPSGQSPIVNTAYAATNTPSQAPAPDPSQYSFSGGVNGSGQAYPGFNSQTSTPVGSAPQTSNTPTNLNNPIDPTRAAQLDALNKLIQNSGQYNQPTQEEQDAMTQLGNLNSSRDLGIAKVTNNPEPLQLLTGQSDFLAKQAEAQAQPLEAQLGILQARRQAAVQGYGQAIGGAEAALGATAPVGIGLGQALVSPNSGQQIAGNASYVNGSGSSGANSLIGSLAQQVLNGTSYNDAVSQLPSAALAPQLLQAITAQNPGFNITDSNQNAGARAQQLNQNVTITQPLKLAMNTALDHIKGLQDIVNKVGYSDSGILNNIRTSVSDNVSSDPNIKTLQSQIGLVREEVAKVLGGGTATDASRNDANSIVPSSISPSQFQSVIGEVEKRMQEKIDEYSKVGNASQYGGQSSGGSLYSF